MRFTLKASTKAFIGNASFTLPEDTEVDFETVDSIDHLAEVLAQKPEVFAAHKDALAHDETAKRIIDGEERDALLQVSYGVGGQRIETIRANAPVAVEPPQQPTEGDDSNASAN